MRSRDNRGRFIKKGKPVVHVPVPVEPKSSDFGLKDMVEVGYGDYLRFFRADLSEEEAENISRNLKQSDKRTKIIKYIPVKRNERWAVYSD